MSQALIPPTYAEAMAVRRQLQQLYGTTAALDYLLATPAPTSAQLTTWLATDANLTAYQQLLSTDAGASAVCVSSTAMDAIVGSTTGLKVLRDSEAGRGALLNSKVAVAAVIATSAAATQLLGNRAARAALYDHETAWETFVASANGKTALAAVAAAEHANATITHVYPPGVGVSTRAVLVSQRQITSGVVAFAGAMADTYTTSVLAAVDRYVRVTGLTHRNASGSNGGSYIRYVVMQP